MSRLGFESACIYRVTVWYTTHVKGDKNTISPLGSWFSFINYFCVHYLPSFLLAILRSKQSQCYNSHFTEDKTEVRGLALRVIQLRMGGKRT